MAGTFEGAHVGGLDFARLYDRFSPSCMLVKPMASIDPSVLILAASNIMAVMVASWLEHRATSRVAETLVKTQKVTDDKLDGIHVLVNNQLTDAVDRLNAASAQIDELKRLLASKEE